ncbi:MAG: transposase, partial [Anaerolineaceae bacterium]
MGFKYRIYPTPEQKILFKQVFGNCRLLWNMFLDKEMKEYQATKKFNWYHANSKCLPGLKKQMEFLKIGPSQAYQAALMDLDQAIKRKCKDKAGTGFPKFKRKNIFENGFRVVQTPDKWKWNEGHITVPKIGNVKWKLHRDIPSGFSTVTISQDGTDYYISLVVEVQDNSPVSDIQSMNNVIGIDLNSNDLAVTSDGVIHQNPKFLKKDRNKIKRRQRQLARAQAGSNRRKRQHLAARKAYRDVSRKRRDFLHKLSRDFVSNYDLICLEDLNVKGMQKFNGTMVGDAGWSTLVGMIGYKATQAGKRVIKINRWAPSSKCCNNCGEVKAKLPTHIRTYSCNHCGVSQSRDINAALNIRDWGLQDYLLSTESFDPDSRPTTGGTPESHGRGDTSIGVGAQAPARYVSLNRQKFLGSLV